MSEHSPSVGIDHPTVVPANFDPDRPDGSNETRASVDDS